MRMVRGRPSGPSTRLQVLSTSRTSPSWVCSRKLPQPLAGGGQLGMRLVEEPTIAPEIQVNEPATKGLARRPPIEPLGTGVPIDNANSRVRGDNGITRLVEQGRVFPQLLLGLASAFLLLDARQSDPDRRHHPGGPILNHIIAGALLEGGDLPFFTQGPGKKMKGRLAACSRASASAERPPSCGRK